MVVGHEGTNLDGSNPYLWSFVARSRGDYLGLVESHAGLLRCRRQLECDLESSLGPGKTAAIVGFCHNCRTYRPMVYDHLHAAEDKVNWRERLVCQTCLLNNRLRLSLHLVDIRIDKGSQLYLTEALTPFAAALRERQPTAVMSEYLGAGCAPGHLRSDGVRHEDVTALSFEDERFDHVLSFDVLEHVPDYERALAEFNRVLRPGGTLLLSVPFVLPSQATIKRARLTATGRIEHLLPPEYHGDPLGKGKGILCYYHFGWDLLESLQNSGFRETRLELFWSLGYCHIGPEQIFILAKK